MDVTNIFWARWHGDFSSIIHFTTKVPVLQAFIAIVCYNTAAIPLHEKCTLRNNTSCTCVHVHVHMYSAQDPAVKLHVTRCYHLNVLPYFFTCISKTFYIEGAWVNTCTWRVSTRGLCLYFFLPACNSAPEKCVKQEIQMEWPKHVKNIPYLYKL